MEKINAALPCVATVEEPPPQERVDAPPPPPPPPQDRVEEPSSYPAAPAVPMVEGPPPKQRAVFIPSSYRDAKREPVTEELVEAKRQRCEEGGSAISNEDEDAVKGASSSSKDKDTDAPAAAAANQQRQQHIIAVMGAAMGRMTGSALNATTRERSVSSSTDKGSAERRGKRAKTAELLARRKAAQLLADDPTWAIADKDTADAVKARTELTDEEALARRQSVKAEGVEVEEEELNDGAADVAAAMTLSPEVAATMVKTKVEQEKHEGWGAVVTVAPKVEDTEGAAAAAHVEVTSTDAAAAAHVEVGGADGTKVASTDAAAAAHVEVRDESLVDASVDEALSDELDVAEDAAVARGLRKGNLMVVLVDPYL